MNAHQKDLPLDVQALGHRLKRKIKGEVRFDDGNRALYATDSSNYRQVPLGVVIPRDNEDVLETFALCRQFGAPVTSRGAGTSLAGQSCNVAVIIDYTKYMNQILELDPVKKLARVQPGVIHRQLAAQAQKFHLTFGPDPATHKWCSFGGMIGNNSCGIHSQMAGRTSDNVHALDLLTYDGTRMIAGQTPDRELEEIIRSGGRRGQIYRDLKALRNRYATLIRERFPRIPRRVSGYNLNELLPEAGFHIARALVGSEGTCVAVLDATVNLVHSPPARSLVILGYADVFQAADHIAEVAAHGPIGLEALDYKFIFDLQKKRLQLQHLKLFPPGKGFLLVEFGGENREESNAGARKLTGALKKSSHPPSIKIFDNPAEEEQVWEVRESGLGATAHIPGEPENWEGWEDSAVHPDNVGNYLRDLKKLFRKYDYDGSLYGHFGQGCVHTRINFDLKTSEGVKQFRSFIDEATTLVTGYNGSLSGEHGDGQSRAEFLPKMFGPELIEAFKEFKTIWDPDWKMNPGKIVHPHRIDENLRYGPHYHPAEPKTHFQYAGDDFSFSRAMERCVGVGECRRHEGGTMCPSYMVTREEMHSTRGRARLLFEMLQGNPLRDRWRSETVRESLDLCLSCKGCKGDCPVHVDMATYKAEFLSHYYRHRLRPLHAYAFGLVHRWAQLASVAPRLANYFSQSPLVSGIGKRLIGIEPSRQIPKFAPTTFKDWFYHRGVVGQASILARARLAAQPCNAGEKPAAPTGPPPVILWPDTFNNYFHPWVAQAAVEVLEDAGFHVLVPKQDMCCGRPLYDYGMLDTARKWLRRILDGMRSEIEAGLPFVVLEPSCCAVFRDELTNLLPHDLDAQRLKNQTFLLSEFLQKRAAHYEPKQLDRKALVHVHCHHRAIMGCADEITLLKKIGLDFQILDSGCCGMAGAFGFEKGDHYEVSVKCGERILLPAVRQAGQDTLIMTNGFSCHEQILQQTNRPAVHLVEVLRLAIREGRVKQREPEVPAIPSHDGDGVGKIRRRWRGWAVSGAGAAIAAVAGSILLHQRKKTSVAQVSKSASH